MKKPILIITALFLILVLVGNACGILDFAGYFRQLFGLGKTVAFEDMTYTRPDIEKLEGSVDAVMKSIKDDKDVDTLMDQILVFYTQYRDFYTNYTLANIHYSIDMSDTYWETEYTYCMKNAAGVDASYDQLMHALADSSKREELEKQSFFGKGYFDKFEGESVWNDAFTELMNQESELQSKYYEISSEASQVPANSEEFYTTYADQLAEVFVEMVALRQQIAMEAGYENYPEFAYNFYHNRDYTAAQATDYMEDIQRELVPLYQTVDFKEILGNAITKCSEAQTFAYVKDMAQSMGGSIAEGFELLEDSGLYHIAYGENKYNASFETYILDYRAPFVFMNPTLTSYDKLTFTHEFGHFCNDYVTGGAKAGVDVAEVFSQGMEYLSLCYGDDGKKLRQAKMADSLSVYVEQAAYASFEHQVYGLTGDELTVETVEALFAQTVEDFGMGSYGVDGRSYVMVTHFFTSPMYVISYVVSNDAAMQLYRMEQEKSGSGLKCYIDNLTTDEGKFLAFLKEAGLESPFEEGGIQAVRKTFEKVLN